MVGNESVRQIIEQRRRKAAARAVEAARRKHDTAGLTNFEWARRYVPGSVPDDPSILHRELDPVLAARRGKRGQRTCIIAPRGSAKSTYVTFIDNLRDICEGRESFIVLVSDTATQAKMFAANIRRELESNPRIREDYPQAYGAGALWNKAEFKTRNGVMVMAAGGDTGLRGALVDYNRPSKIVVDDPEGDKGARSAAVRSAVWDTFTKSTLKLGDTNTNVDVIGTVMHRECLVGRVRDTLPGWKKVEYNSIVNWPDRMDLWHEWESIFLDLWNPESEQQAEDFIKANYDEMHAGAVVLWPEHESLAHLMKIRAMEGHTSFESEKQNNPVNPEDCEWPSSYFDNAPRFEKWPESYRVRVMYLDPSKGKDAKRGDYSAFTLLQVGDDGTLYVECDMKRRPVERIVLDGVSLMRDFKPQFFGCEANQFQELLADTFYRQVKDAGIAASIVKDENLLNKVVRIRTIGGDLEHQRIAFRRTPMTEMLISQLRDFPDPSVHDDGPDSLEGARRLALSRAGGPRRISLGGGERSMSRA